MPSEDMDDFERSGVMEAFKEENIQYISQEEMNMLFPPSIFEDFLEAERIKEDKNE